MGVLVGALGALGAMLMPGAVGHGVETHSVFVATAVIVVVLILAYVTNPSAASFRTFLTELAFRRHLSKLHDASEADPPALTWARHSHQIDAAPHLQFATRASVSVRSSAHIFRSFGVLTIAAVTPVADHRNKRNQTNSFASDQGRWFLGAFGKWWLGGALLLGKADDGHSTAGLLDIRLLDDSELSKWTVVPEPAGRRTPPPLPKHASLPLHTQAKQPAQKPSKSKAKSKPTKANAAESIPPTSSPANPSNTTNIDAHPLLADLLQHIATTQTTLSNARAQLAQLHTSTAHTREQTEDHIAQRTKHNSASSTSEAAKTHTHQLTNARRTLRASQKTLAGVQATHDALEQRANTLIEEAKSLQEKVIRDGEKVKEGEAKGEIKRGELADAIVARKEELRSLEEEVMGSSGENKEVVGLVGKVRALEAEVKEARKTLDELKAWQASLGEQLTPEDLESRGPEQEQEKEKEPGVVYIGQTPVRAVPLNTSSQVTPQRIQGVAASHARITSSPGTAMAHSTIPHPVNQHVTSPTAITAPSPAAPVTDVASPARSARSKGYAIFDTDLASLGGPKAAGLSAKKPAVAAPIGKGLVKVPGMGVTGASVTAPIVKDHPGSTNIAPTRPTFAPFDSDTPPIPIPKRTNSGYALNPEGTKYNPVASTKFGDGLSFGLPLDSPTSGTFSPPLTSLLPSSLFSEDGHRWDGEAASPGPFSNGSSPAQLINESGSSPSQFGNTQWTNGTSPGNYRNGTSPARWEKDADGWVNEAKPAANSWDSKAFGNGFIPSKDGRDGWIGDSDAWTGEGLRRWESPAGNGVWAPRAEGRPRSVSVESRFEAPAGRPRSDSYEAHRLSSGADSGYHTATNPSTAPKKRNSGSSSGEDAVQDAPTNGLSFSPPFLQQSPVSGSIDAPASSFGSGIFGPPNQLSTRRGYDAQRVSLAARVPLIREVEESDPTATSESAPSTSPAKSRRWFPSVGSAKKDLETSVRAQKSELNPDAKAFSFSPDSKIFNFTRGRTFSLTPPAPADPPASTFVPFGLGASANSSTPALGNGSVSGANSGTYFSSLLAFAPSPAEREALQRALGTNGITRTLSNTSARSPFTSPLPSARSSAVDLSDKAALAWNESTPTPVVQKRTWFPVRKKAAVEESE